MERMLHDYIDRFYLKEGKRTRLLKADQFAKAKEIAAWKEEFVSKWNDIEICSVSIPDGLLYNPHVGEEYEMSVVLDNKGLGNCLGVELVIANVEEGNTEPYKTLEMEPVQTDGTKVTYKIQYQLNDSGVFRYSSRCIQKSRPATSSRFGLRPLVLTYKNSRERYSAIFIVKPTLSKDKHQTLYR